jgi:hypothetical protein
MDFLLTIMMPDLHAFLASEEHPGVAVGKDPGAIPPKRS